MRSLGYIACLLFPTPICQCIVRVWHSCMWSPTSWQTSIQNPIPSPTYPYTPHTVVTWPKDTYTSIRFYPPQFSPGEARSSVWVQSQVGKEFWNLRNWTWLWVGVSPRPCGLLTQGREHLETNQPKVLKMLGPAIPTGSGACSRLSKSRRNHDLLSQTIAGHFFFLVFGSLSPSEKVLFAPFYRKDSWKWKWSDLSTQWVTVILQSVFLFFFSRAVLFHGTTGECTRIF